MNAVKDEQQKTLHKNIVPTNQESTFNFEELFFSFTDKKSKITSANEVFIRVSKYEKHEIIGKLHNVVRHPDMPGSVFKIFWDYIQADKPVAAYVKNLAKDGSYYWVMALAFPVEDGYLSIRLKPGSELFGKVKKLYADVLAYEKEAERATDRRKALRAAEVYMIEQLKTIGFNDYDHFMRNALQDEMVNRQKVLDSKGHVPDFSTLKGEESLNELNNVLKKLLLSSENLRGIHKALSGYSNYLLSLARSILLLSMNAQVGAAKLNSEDHSLSVVAENMGQQTIAGEKKLTSIKEQLNDFSDMVGNLNFELISTKLQIEMTLDFKKELAECDLCEDEFKNEIRMLENSFKPKLKTVCEGIEAVPAYMKKLFGWIKEIEKFLMVLRFIHISGEIEIARMNQEGGSFKTTFQDLLQEIKHAEKQVKGLTNVVTDNSRVLNEYVSHQKTLSRFMKEL